MKKKSKIIRNADGLDESAFLPQFFNPVTGKMETENVATPERWAKGDIEENGKNGAQVKDVTVLGHLIDKGILEEYHRECAITIIELRHAMLNQTGYKINSRVLTDFVGGSVESTSVGAVLDSVTRTIKLWRLNGIERAFNQPAAQESGPESIVVVNAYREWFNMLYDALKDAWKAAAKEKEKSKECC